MFVIAHRGASGYEPENTIAAFEKAIAMGADYIELDIQQTRDQAIVVWHDTRLNHGEVLAELTYEQLQQKAAKLNRDLPLLKDVLKKLDGRVKINIEIKTIKIIDDFLDIISDYDHNQFIISSFNHEYIQNIRQKAPGLTFGALIVSRLLDPLSILNSLNTNILIQHFEHVDSEYVRFLHKNQKKILVWNINNQQDMFKFKEIEVDGIFTDYPDLAVKIAKDI